MSKSMSAATTNAKDHDHEFVDTDTYLQEMALRIQRLRSLIPVRLEGKGRKIDRTSAEQKPAKNTKRGLKAGVSA